MDVREGFELYNIKLSKTAETEFKPLGEGNMPSRDESPKWVHY